MTMNCHLLDHCSSFLTTPLLANCKLSSNSRAHEAEIHARPVAELIGDECAIDTPLARETRLVPLSSGHHFLTTKHLPRWETVILFGKPNSLGHQFKVLRKGRVKEAGLQGPFPWVHSRAT